MAERYHPGVVIVSVVVLCRNAVPTLPRFLETLGDLHRRTLPDFPELVFVDDASTDGTTRLLFHWGETAFLPVKVLGLDRPSGRGACLREALALTSGDAVAVVSADEKNFPDKLRILLDAYVDTADVVLADASPRPLDRISIALIGALAGLPIALRRPAAAGLSLWNADVLRRSLANGDGFALAANMLARARTAGATIRVTENVRSEAPPLSPRLLDWIRAPANDVRP